jgi:putative transposase
LIAPTPRVPPFVQRRQSPRSASTPFSSGPTNSTAILSLPEDDADYPNRWRRIKGHFTSAVIAAGPPVVPDAKGEYRIWQRRHWEHTMRDEDDFARHVDYIHINPVKRGHVARVGG